MSTNTVHIQYLRDAKEIYTQSESGLAYATEGSAGLDLRACMEQTEACIPAGGRLSVSTGICIEPLDSNLAAFVYSRSGLGAVQGLVVAQGVGVIDTDYRGEIIVWLLNTTDEARSIKRGDRIAQLVFQPFVRAQLEEGELSSTSRGTGGFGHTGTR